MLVSSFCIFSLNYGNIGTVSFPKLEPGTPYNMEVVTVSGDERSDTVTAVIYTSMITLLNFFVIFKNK